MAATQPTRSDPDLVTRPGFVLWNVALAWQRAMSAALRPLDLTPAQFVVLDAVASFDRDGVQPNQLMICARACTGITMTSQILTRLVDAGLVVRMVDPGDGRANQVTLTGHGRSVARRAAELAEEADSSFFSADDPSTLALRRMAATVTSPCHAKVGLELQLAGRRQATPETPLTGFEAADR